MSVLTKLLKYLAIPTIPVSLLLGTTLMKPGFALFQTNPEEITIRDIGLLVAAQTLQEDGETLTDARLIELANTFLAGTVNDFPAGATLDPSSLTIANFDFVPDGQITIQDLAILIAGQTLLEDGVDPRTPAFADQLIENANTFLVGTLNDVPPGTSINSPIALGSQSVLTLPTAIDVGTAGNLQINLGELTQAEADQLPNQITVGGAQFQKTTQAPAPGARNTVIVIYIAVDPSQPIGAFTEIIFPGISFVLRISLTNPITGVILLPETSTVIVVIVVPPPTPTPIPSPTPTPSPTPALPTVALTIPPSLPVGAVYPLDVVATAPAGLKSASVTVSGVPDPLEVGTDVINAVCTNLTSCTLNFGVEVQVSSTPGKVALTFTDALSNPIGSPVLVDPGAYSFSATVTDVNDVVSAPAVVSNVAIAAAPTVEIVLPATITAPGSATVIIGATAGGGADQFEIVITAPGFSETYSVEAPNDPLNPCRAGSTTCDLEFTVSFAQADGDNVLLTVTDSLGTTYPGVVGTLGTYTFDVKAIDSLGQLSPIVSKTTEVVEAP